jgi:hypothetical protein
VWVNKRRRQTDNSAKNGPEKQRFQGAGTEKIEVGTQAFARSLPSITRRTLDPEKNHSRMNLMFRQTCRSRRREKKKAGDGDRTHDNHVGNVMLYH